MEGQTFPFIVASPQCPTRSCWLPEQILDLVEEICASYRVDTDWIYLTGFSMGGYGTWVTAIAPICGTPGDAMTTPTAMAEALTSIRHLPIWAFKEQKTRHARLRHTRRPSRH